MNQCKDDGRFTEEKWQRLRYQPEAEKGAIDKATLTKNRDPSEGPHKNAGQERNQYQQPK